MGSHGEVRGAKDQWSMICRSKWTWGERGESEERETLLEPEGDILKGGCDRGSVKHLYKRDNDLCYDVNNG